VSGTRSTLPSFCWILRLIVHPGILCWAQQTGVLDMLPGTAYRQYSACGLLHSVQGPQDHNHSRSRSSHVKRTMKSIAVWRENAGSTSRSRDGDAGNASSCDVLAACTAVHAAEREELLKWQATKTEAPQLDCELRMKTDQLLNCQLAHAVKGQAHLRHDIWPAFNLHIAQRCHTHTWMHACIQPHLGRWWAIGLQ
jgi:hypothetical protein